jgi:hypothetical protein
MTELLALIPTAILGFLLWQEKRDRRDAEQAWRLERVGLLNRIQAPETVVHEQFEPSSLKQYVGFDSDEEYWDAKELTNGDS